MTQLINEDLFVYLFKVHHLLSSFFRLAYLALNLFLFVLQQINSILNLLFVIGQRLYADIRLKPRRELFVFPNLGALGLCNRSWCLIEGLILYDNLA